MQDQAHSDPICPLGLRPIPPDVPQSVHHLIPKLKGGKGGPTVLLHQICHKEIHAALSEADLACVYNTPEMLRLHPRRRDGYLLDGTTLKGGRPALDGFRQRTGSAH